MSKSRETNNTYANKHVEIKGINCEMEVSYSIFNWDDGIMYMPQSDFELLYKNMTYFIDEINAEKAKKGEATYERT